MTRLPYPGLRPFRRDESDLFFGREGSVDAMVDKLTMTRFLAVLGSSGSGKSSLVRTGLLDALELGLSPRMGSAWRIADFRPGERPLHHLAQVLLAGAGRGEPDAVQHEMLRDFLGRGPRSLLAWCQDGNLPADCNLLLLVDQFEELFRYDEYAGREEAESFVALLLESVREAGGRIYVTITMRSEFLGACSLLPGLAERINEGLYLTSRMSREQCRDAIVGPAAVTGFHIEPALVNRMLNDLANFAPWEDAGGNSPLMRVSRRADQLPLMQHVLNRLWLRQGSRGGDLCLTLKDYEAVGALGGALDEHGEEILDRIGRPQLRMVELVFRSLISGSSRASAVRRPTPMHELVRRCGGDAVQVQRIVDELRSEQCNFLQPPLATPLQPDTVVDITHESLIRQWKRLSEWLDNEARAAEHWTQLSQSAGRHFQGQGDLLQGLNLAATGAWWREDQPTPKWAERYGGQYEQNQEFLARSQKEAGRVGRQRRLQRATIFSLMSVAVASVSINWYQSAAANARLENANLDLANTNESLRRAKSGVDRQVSTTDRMNAELLDAQSGLQEQAERLKLKNSALDSAQKQLALQNQDLQTYKARVEPYADVYALADEVRRIGFASSPAVNTDAAGIALRGYDTVGYHLKKASLEGKLQHHSLWNGAIWLFESAENKRLFETAPERYAPAFGGFCTPCLAAGHKYQAVPTAWYIHEGRLYLAYNDNLIGEFKKDPGSYIPGATDKWKSMQSVRVSPSSPTLVGALLVPQIRRFNLPDAYWILKDSAADYNVRRDWWNATAEQRELITHLNKLPQQEPRRANLPEATRTLAWYYLLGGQFDSAQRVFSEAPRPDTMSELLTRLGLAHLQVLAAKPGAQELYRADLGKLIPGLNTWEDQVLEDVARIGERLGEGATGLFDKVRPIVATKASFEYVSRAVRAASKEKKWPQAVEAQEGLMAYLQRLPEQNKRRSTELPGEHSFLCYYQLLAKQFSKALQSCETSRELGYTGAPGRINRAHALLLNGRNDAAIKLYRDGRGSKVNDKTFEAEVISDLGELESAGIRHAEFPRVRAMMNAHAAFNKVYDTSRAAKTWQEGAEAQTSVVDYLRGLPADDPFREYLPGQLQTLARWRLFSKNYAGSLLVADEYLQSTTGPEGNQVRVVRAHALLLLDRVAEAEEMYRRHRGEDLGKDKKWEAGIREDLDALEKEGIKHPAFGRIRALIGGKPE